MLSTKINLFLINSSFDNLSEGFLIWNLLNVQIIKVKY